MTNYSIANPSIVTASVDVQIEYIAYGGGGGGGGSDGWRNGGNGKSGGKVSGIITLRSGEVLYCYPGGGGAGGWSKITGSSQPEALGGTALAGYSGGWGGKAGPVGYSGYGGGGGAASVIFKKKVDGTTEVIAVAGGGGGGGGAGKFSDGKTSQDSPYGLTNIYESREVYPVTSSNWSSFMNTFGVSVLPEGEYQPAGNTYSVSRLFYINTAQTYEVHFAVDDAMHVYVDGEHLTHSANSYLKNVPSGLDGGISKYLSVGWHRMTVYYGNSHGPYIDYSGNPSGYAIAIYDDNTNLIWHTRMNLADNTPAYPLNSRGGRGQTRTPDGSTDLGVDGGAGGGGGGGYPGGQGGIIVAGDSGSEGGSSGYNYATGTNTTSEYNKSIELFAGFGIYGAGGEGAPYSNATSASSGSSGLISLTSIGTYGISVRSVFSFLGLFDFNYWATVSGVYFRQAGAWTPVNEVYIRNNGQWAKVHGSVDLNTNLNSEYSVEQLSNPPVWNPLALGLGSYYDYNAGGWVPGDGVGGFDGGTPGDSEGSSSDSAT